LIKNNLVEAISEEDMYDLIKSETIDPVENQLTELEVLQTTNQLLDR
jgi:hypothetical protein